LKDKQDELGVEVDMIKKNLLRRIEEEYHRLDQSKWD